MSFFAASKLLWFAVEPSHLLVWIAILAAIFRNRILAAIVALSLVLLLTVPVGNWALRPLEDAYPRPDWPGHVDGILVLGEGLTGEVLASRGVPGIGQDGGTLLAAVALAKRYPDARLVFTGGSGELGGSVAEARVAEHIFGELGLAPLYEDKARNTYENLLFARDLAAPKDGETWLLVAEALHMPRAMAVARKLGWKLLPWPSDYLTLKDGQEGALSLALNLAHLDKAVHEAVGLLAYRLSGKGA